MPTASALECPVFLKKFWGAIVGEKKVEKFAQPFIYNGHKIFTKEELKLFSEMYSGEIYPYVKTIEVYPSDDYFYVYFRQLPTKLQNFLEDHMTGCPVDTERFLLALKDAAKLGDDSFITTITSYLHKDPKFAVQRHAVWNRIKFGMSDLKHLSSEEYLQMKAKVQEDIAAAIKVKQTLKTEE